MNSEQNMVVYRQIIAAVNDTNADALDDLMAADVIDHNALPDQAPGIEGFK
ncbi:MAG: ester cyclase [Chloroflexi bacterium]|nr:ester cyclase [Chloroflexota bacterium]